jgi:hypothetical protein
MTTTVAIRIALLAAVCVIYGIALRPPEGSAGRKNMQSHLSAVMAYWLWLLLLVRIWLR